MIVFIPRTDPQSNPWEEPDWEWLPETCPACAAGPVNGHGRRRKQAHGRERCSIRYRRGICKCCDQTLTVLPAWSLPYTHYTLRTRQESGAGFGSGRPLEEAAPTLADADRCPDAATLRRWFQRRVSSLDCWLRLLGSLRMWLAPPTILAWDWQWAIRILIPETSPG